MDNQNDGSPRAGVYPGAGRSQISRPHATQAFVLTDSFQYKSNDGQSDGDVATVTLAAADSDGDGLADFIEDEIGSSNNSSDTDGDGVSDLAEYLSGRDPTINEGAIIIIILQSVLK